MRSSEYLDNSKAEPVRLAYRMSLRGRGQGVVVEARRRGEKTTLVDGDLQGLLTRLHALDEAIVRELRSGPVFGHLGDNQFARVLPLLVQRRIEIDDEKLKVSDAKLRPRLRVEGGQLGGVRLSLYLEDPEDGEIVELEDGRLIAGSQAYFLRGPRAIPVDAPNPWELAPWARTPVLELSGELNPNDRDRMARDFAKMGIPDDDVQQLAVSRAPPDRFVAKLWASPDGAVAHLLLEADYQGDLVVITGQRPSSPFILSQKHGGGVTERDLVGEEESRQVLRELGFRYDKASATYIAKQEVGLRALDPNATVFPQHWHIERTADAPHFHRDLSLTAEVKLLADRGLLDLSIDIGAKDGLDESATVDALIEMKDLLKWLHSGKSYLQLQDGSYVAPSEEFRKSLAALDDLGADSKRVLVSPLCVGLLRILGDASALSIADDATRAWLNELSGISRPAEVAIPEGLNGEMRDYQHRGLDWLAMLHRYRLTGILADDMGLGKTMQTLALLLHVRDTEGPKPCLVVAPTSVVTVWRDEAERFAPGLKVALWHGPPQVRHSIDIHSMDLLVTSYGVLRRDAEILAKTGFRYVILDEAQSAKNAASQNARAIRQLNSERRLALTGTPIENRPEELWAAFDFLAPGFLGSPHQFRKRYARPIERNEKDASELLRARISPLVLRRMKNEVAKDLPPRIESVLRCSMDGPQRALYEHVSGELRDSIQARIATVGIERAHMAVLAALTRLRQICCDPALLPNPNEVKVPHSAKLELFTELMREALDADHRVVVFSQFVQMQKILIKAIESLGVTPLWLHGGTRDRKKVIDGFQDPEGPPVIVVSLKAGGTGLTLTRADTVIHYDPWWNPAVERQATDRAHRIGQTQRVNVYKLVCEQTIEEKVLQLAARKDQMAEELLGSEGGAGGKHITRDEVLALLQ